MDQVLIIVLNVKFHMLYTKDNVKNHVQITITTKKENAKSVLLLVLNVSTVNNADVPLVQMVPI
jgi:hypothetical protein